VGAIVDADALPIEPAAREWFNGQGADVTTAVLTGGDDYELLIAVKPRRGRRLAAARRHGDVPLTRVGVCTEDMAIVLTSGSPLPSGYQHFR
jgi:thiamine-monophosphate kinase